MDTGTNHWLTHVLVDLDVTISMTGYIPPRVRIEMTMGICLHIKNPEIEQGDYPACRIQKGLVLVHENKDLSEEGIGFGVPVLRFGHETIFPGDACVSTEKDGDIWW
jgi:hypothetical protein